MKYYSEKLGKLFDTEKELRVAESQSDLVEEAKEEIVSSILEFSNANSKLESCIEKYVKKLGEDECNKILDWAFDEVKFDENLYNNVNRNFSKKESRQEQEDKISKILNDRDELKKIQVEWVGLQDLIKKIFEEDE